MLLNAGGQGCRTPNHRITNSPNPQILDYWKYAIRCTPDTAEVLLAFLAEGPFDTFEEVETGLDAYCPSPPQPPRWGGVGFALGIFLNANRSAATFHCS